MNAKIIPLSSSRHGNIRVASSENYSYIRKEYLIPLLMQEFVVAGCEYPIVFVKNEQTGTFLPVALMGLQQNENLFYQNGRWDGLYVPRVVRNYPFSLAFNDKDKQKFVVCIDEASNLLNKEEGDFLFDAKGEQTLYLKDRIECMVADAKNSELTSSFVNALLEAALLAAKRLTFEIDNNRRTVHGLYGIDEAKLNSMQSSLFEKLRKNGVLPAIYAHIGSLHQIPRLIRRKQEQSILENED